MFRLVLLVLGLLLVATVVRGRTQREEVTPTAPDWVGRRTMADPDCEHLPEPGTAYPLPYLDRVMRRCMKCGCWYRES